MEKYIKELLEQQKRAIIPNFGALTYIDGIVSFNPWLKNDINDSFANLVAQGDNIPVDEAKNKINDFVNALTQSINETGKATINGIGEFYKDGDTISFNDGNASPVGLDLSESIVDESNPEPISKEEESNATTSSTSTYGYDDDSEKSNKKLIIILLIILLFIIGAILCLFVINKDNCVYNYFFGEKEEATEVVVQPEPKVEEAPAVEEEPVQENTKASPFEKRYNIIVGTYKTESVAQARVTALKNKGFDHAFVGRYKGNYVAVIDSFDSLPEAEARQEQIVDNYRIENYITNSGE